MMFLRLFTESLNFAWRALVNNKLRTFLSLLGVTIGILAIISVFTIVDSLEKNVRQSVSKLGSDVIYVQKWSWAILPKICSIVWFVASSTKVVIQLYLKIRKES